MGTASGDIRNAHRELTQEVDRVLCDQDPQVIVGALKLLSEMNSSSLPLSQQLKCLRERKWSPLLSNRSPTSLSSPNSFSPSIPSLTVGEFSSTFRSLTPPRPAEEADLSRFSPPLPPLEDFSGRSSGRDRSSPLTDRFTETPSPSVETSSDVYDVAEQLMLAFSRFSHPLEEKRKLSPGLDSSSQAASLRDQEARKLFQSLGFETQEEYFNKVATQGYFNQLSENLVLTFDAMLPYVTAMATSIPKPLPPRPIGTRQAPGTVVVKICNYLEICDKEARLERQKLLSGENQRSQGEELPEELLESLRVGLARFDEAVASLKEGSSFSNAQTKEINAAYQNLTRLKKGITTELEKIHKEIEKGDKLKEEALSPLKLRVEQLKAQIQKLDPVIESARLQANKKMWVDVLIKQFYEKPQRVNFSTDPQVRAAQWEEIAGRLEVVFDERSLEDEGLSMLFADGDSGLEGVTQFCFNGCIERVQALSSTKEDDGPAAFALFTAVSHRREIALGKALEELFRKLLDQDATAEERMDVHSLALMKQLLNEPYKLCYIPRELGVEETANLEIIRGRTENDPDFDHEEICESVLKRNYHEQSILKYLKEQFSKLEPDHRERLLSDASNAFANLLRMQSSQSAAPLELVPPFDEAQLCHSILAANEMPATERLTQLRELHTAFIEEDKVPPFSMSCKKHEARAKVSLKGTLEPFKETPTLGRIYTMAQKLPYLQSIKYLEQQLGPNKLSEKTKGESIIPKFQESLNRHKKEVKEDSVSTKTVTDHQEEVREAVQQHLEGLGKKTAADDPSYYRANRAAFEKLISRFPLSDPDGKSAPGRELTDYGSVVLAIARGLVKTASSDSQPALIAQEVGSFIYEGFSSPEQVAEKLKNGQIELVRFLPREILERPEIMALLRDDPLGDEMVLITLDEGIWSLETIPEDLLSKARVLKTLVNPKTLQHERVWKLVERSEELLEFAIEKGYLDHLDHPERPLPGKIIASDELLLKLVRKYPSSTKVAIKDLPIERLQQDGLIWKLSKLLYASPIEKILGKEKYGAMKSELLKQIVQDHDYFLYALSYEFHGAIPMDCSIAQLVEQAERLGKDAGFILAGLHQGYFDRSKHNLEQLLEKAQTQGDLHLAGKALFHLLDQFERFEGTSIQGLLRDREFQSGFVRGADDREALKGETVHPQAFIEKAIKQDYLDLGAFEAAPHWLKRPGVVLKLLEKRSMDFSEVDSSLRNDPRFLLRYIEERNPRYFDALKEEDQKAVIDCFITRAGSVPGRRPIDYYDEILAKTEDTTFKGRLMEDPRAALVLLKEGRLSYETLPDKLIDGCMHQGLAFALMRKDQNFFHRFDPSLQENPLFLATCVINLKEGLFDSLAPLLQRKCAAQIVEKVQELPGDRRNKMWQAITLRPTLLAYLGSEREFAGALCAKGLLAWNSVNQSLRSDVEFVTSHQRVYEAAKSYAATHPQEPEYALDVAMD